MVARSMSSRSVELREEEGESATESIACEPLIRLGGRSPISTCGGRPKPRHVPCSFQVREHFPASRIAAKPSSQRLRPEWNHPEPGVPKTNAPASEYPSGARAETGDALQPRSSGNTDLFGKCHCDMRLRGRDS